jgi:hypothetical protein
MLPYILSLSKGRQIAFEITMAYVVCSDNYQQITISK